MELFAKRMTWELVATLPTPDEWAYLCGGGCRTLFPSLQTGDSGG